MREYALPLALIVGINVAIVCGVGQAARHTEARVSQIRPASRVSVMLQSLGGSYPGSLTSTRPIAARDRELDASRHGDMLQLLLQ